MDTARTEPFRTGAGDPGGPVEAVVLDFYGTLVRLVPPLPPSHDSVLRRRGLHEAADRWGDQWSTGPGDGEDHREHSRSESAYRAWEVDRLRRRALDRGVPAELAAEVAAELDTATKTLTLERYPDAVAPLAALRERGVRIVICSNWYWDLDRAVADTGLGQVVDAFVASARAGARKPNPLIYRAALDACGTPPGRTLFVGDMWEPDVVGPLAQGMRAVHLHRPDRAVEGDAPPLPAGAARITGLDALPGLVERAGPTGPAGPFAGSATGSVAGAAPGALPGAVPESVEPPGPGTAGRGRSG
ncbi:HAD family hydrolase [Streptomyces sp. NPDC059248]|uniref:HAD family hydrolase n=1 Tax=Streptomyces sp. NPDC059248 TaxID=3346791 RepID=UPI0036C3A4E7